MTWLRACGFSTHSYGAKDEVHLVQQIAPYRVAQNLLDQVRSELQLTEGDIAMFVLDVPDVPLRNAPILVAQLGQGALASDNKTRKIGVCKPVPNFGPLPPVNERGEYGIGPIRQAEAYFRLYEHKEAQGAVKVVLLQSPKHGNLQDEGNGNYTYLPNSGYLGTDSATLQVEIGGQKVQVVYFFQAVNFELDDQWKKELCGRNGYRWKISAAPIDGSFL